jgi:hypothetical protein
MTRVARFVAFLYLPASVFALFLPLLGDRTLFFRDVQPLFMPMKHFLAECWSRGELPMWNPLIFCGAPFLSDIQAGVFYPLSAFFYLLPMPYAFNIFVISHYIIAVCLVYALTRHWGCSRPAACLSALCFSLGGYLVSSANVLNNLQSAIWLPGIFLCFEKSFGRHALFYRLLTAILLAIQFLGGEPQLVLFTLLLLLTYNLVVNKQTSWSRHLLKTGIAMAFIGTISIALVMAQLIPTWEMFRHSIRASGFNFQEAAKFSLNPMALFQLLSPPPFDIYYTSKKEFSWLVSNYFGYIPLVFAVTAIFFVRSKRVKFWAVCMFVSVIFAFGKHTPLFFLLYKALPYLSAFRFPAKFMFIFAYGIAFLVAFGFDHVVEKRHTVSRNMMAFLAIIFVLFLIACIVRIVNPPFLVDHVLLPFRLILFAFGFLLCTFIFFRKAITGVTFAVLVVLVSTVDLLVAHTPFNPVTHSVFYTDEPGLVHAIGKNPRSERIFAQTCSYNHLQGRELSPFTLQHLWRQYLRPNTGTLYDISYVDGIGGIETEDQWLITELLQKLNFCKRIRFLELTNTRYLVTMVPADVENEIVAGRLKRTENNVYELPHALPRAYMVRGAKIMPNRAKAIEEILKDDFDPWQFVVVEKRSRTPITDGQGGTVLNTYYEGANRIRVRAQSLGGYLTLLDSFYPGWRVYVDGRERELLRANGLFKAVFLEPGKHQVVFTYQPTCFAWGFGISLLSICLVVFGLWVWRPRRRL